MKGTNNIRRIFIANRGEVAVRIVRACRDLDIKCVVGVSEADRNSMAARLADRAICIGPASASESYLRPEFAVTAAAGTGCDAIHPGYGFLSERSILAEYCANGNLIFIGPTPQLLELMGDKIAACSAARAANVPTLPCSPAIETIEAAAQWAKKIGYPCIMKASAGGGGRGMRIIKGEKELQAKIKAARAESLAAFGDSTFYLEKYVERALHIEVQILGDQFGNILHLYERDCSVQRRHQKIVEEAPAPSISEETRQALLEAAVCLASSVKYIGAGTVEFLFNAATEEFYFLEMNARLQVEHAVTEQVTSIDIVKEQILVAEGRRLSFTEDDVRLSGCAIECRITAEDPTTAFTPCPGTIERWGIEPDSDIRIDTHCYSGYRIPPYYDSLLAKIVSTGRSRKAAIDRLKTELKEMNITGVTTTAPLLADIINSEDFRSSNVTTSWLEAHFLPHWLRKQSEERRLQ